MNLHCCLTCGCIYNADLHKNCPCCHPDSITELEDIELKTDFPEELSGGWAKGSAEVFMVLSAIIGLIAIIFLIIGSIKYY